MRLCLSGATGLLGQALRTYLTAAGYHIQLLIRKESDRQGASDHLWSPEKGFLQPEALQGVDALIHLSGAGIAASRWSTARRHVLWKSRIDSTELLIRTLAQVPKETRPASLICASAISYYPYSQEIQDEDSPAGKGFLSELCTAWERSAKQATDRYGLRVVRFRIGLVLSPDGGVLAPLLRAERLRLAVKFGGGQQYMSWIHIHDLVRLTEQALVDPSWSGAYNAVAPLPVTQKDFLTTLASTLRHRRPWLPSLPAPLLRLALGEMSDLVLKGQRIHPTRAVAAGFQFQFKTLDNALHNLLPLPPLSAPAFSQKNTSQSKH